MRTTKENIIFSISCRIQSNTNVISQSIFKDNPSRGRYWKYRILYLPGLFNQGVPQQCHSRYSQLHVLQKWNWKAPFYNWSFTCTYTKSTTSTYLGQSHILLITQLNPLSNGYYIENDTFTHKVNNSNGTRIVDREFLQM